MLSCWQFQKDRETKIGWKQWWNLMCRKYGKHGKWNYESYQKWRSWLGVVADWLLEWNIDGSHLLNVTRPLERDFFSKDTFFTCTKLLLWSSGAFIGDRLLLMSVHTHPKIFHKQVTKTSKLVDPMRDKTLYFNFFSPSEKKDIRSKGVVLTYFDFSVSPKKFQAEKK